MIDYKAIQDKWQKRWEEAKLYEVEPNEKKSLLVTAAFPYVNTPLHIGHLRTYGTADAYARYMRMRGFNVLYPMAFHATGTPVLAFAKRIANNDQEIIDELKMFHIPDEDIKKMTEPTAIVNYFIPESRHSMTSAGLGLDWRRTFVSTEPLYSKMVEWQFINLKEKGLLTQGSHPVGWCPNENNAVGQHDTKHDAQPEIEEVAVLKFKEEGGDAYFACATFRPETIYGVTNLFVGEKIEYVIARMQNESYYLSKDAAAALAYQYKVEVIGQISASDLLKKSAVNPINNEKVPILPGYFVKPDVGTGVVMSVPAHAPFDYVALERLRAKGVAVPANYVQVVKTKDEAPVELPAIAALKLLEGDANSSDEIVERATKELYKDEAHNGKMLLGEYKGKPEPEAREMLKQELVKKGSAIKMYMLANEEPVQCRCGYRVVVKLVENQWFINYGDQKWKEKVREAFKQLRILPEKYRLSFAKIIDWIDLRAMERAQGLGTRFPLNPEHVIESLSDSTLYMCFYTFVHILRGANVAPDKLKPEFFDYVLLGKGGSDSVAKTTGLDPEVIRKCSESFDYWYAMTSRHSAPDLLPNHYAMYFFNHVAFFPKEHWPKQIVVNGMVNYEGQKMSKSLGNLIPVIDGVEKYGADPLRFIEIAGADLDADTEFSMTALSSVFTRNEFIYNTILSLPDMKSKELTHIDYWLYSRLNSKIESATHSMDDIGLKNAYTDVFYNSVNELKWYIERGGSNELVMREFLEDITIMLSPIMPHIAEEFWQMMGKDTFVARENWPAVNESMVNKEEELIEKIIMDTVEDIGRSVELTSKGNAGKKVGRIKLIIAEDWKLAAYNSLANSKNISKSMDDPALEKVDKERLSKFFSQFAKKMQALAPIENASSDSVLKSFIEAQDYISRKFNAAVLIEREKGSGSSRASRSLPDKPAIDIAWE